MNIQIYYTKRNFDVQKAERFFKERRVSFQLVDMAKNRPGKREMELFARVFGVKNIINSADPKVRESTVCYMSDEALIIEELMEKPQLMKSPIVRNGQKATLGADEKKWQEWLAAEEKK